MKILLALSIGAATLCACTAPVVPITDQDYGGKYDAAQSIIPPVYRPVTRSHKCPHDTYETCGDHSENTTPVVEVSTPMTMAPRDPGNPPMRVD